MHFNCVECGKPITDYTAYRNSLGSHCKNCYDYKKMWDGAILLALFLVAGFCILLSFSNK